MRENEEVQNEQVQVSAPEVNIQYNRVKGAEWFPSLHKRDIMVLGQGGIGSWVSLLLSRIGCSLHIFDMDRYEIHNMSGQVVRKKDVGSLKTEAIEEIITEFSPDAEVYTYEAYEDDSMTNDIVICGFDNMAARKLAFEKWVNHITDPGVTEKDCFFQDGRLLAEQLQIINIPGNRIDLITRYKKEYLFDDSEVPDLDCTFKQTSHCAAMIASHMVGFLTNWVSNVQAGESFKQVPFFYEYSIPLNMQQQLT